MKFPQRGKYDNSATPNEIYKLLINELGFVDVCVDPSRFDFLREEAPDRAYCNPPFSSKFLFIEKACEVSRKGKLIVLLLPADISTRWFTKAFFECKASVIFIAGKRMHGRRSRYPTMLLVFNGKQEVYIVKYDKLREFLLNYLRK